MYNYGYIYIHKNKENGHIYVGQSIQDPKRRFRKTESNYNSYKTCPAMYAALVKYGWESFDTETICWSDNQENLNWLEEYFIKYFHSADGKNGYNTVKFSEGRGLQSESTKEKIRIKQLNYNKKLREAGMIKVSPKRREHTIIDGVEGKLCTGTNPNHWAPLTAFGVKADTWDGLLHDCRECRKLAMREYRKTHPPKKLSKEEFQASYKNRKFSEGQKRRFNQKRNGTIEDPV